MNTILMYKTENFVINLDSGLLFVVGSLTHLTITDSSHRY